MKLAQETLANNKSEADESLNVQLATVGDEIDKTQIALKSAIASAANALQQKDRLVAALNIKHTKENELYSIIRKHDVTFTGKVSAHALISHFRPTH
jgi:uncharacterized protein YgbK (DUF1537 family)